MRKMLDRLGRLNATIWTSRSPATNRSCRASPRRCATRQDDVLLVEGNARISGVIRYLTQSTWSHAALYVGPIKDRFTPDGEPHVLMEANAGEGVVSAPLSKYCRFHTSICRPFGRTEPDRAIVRQMAKAAKDVENSHCLTGSVALHSEQVRVGGAVPVRKRATAPMSGLSASP